jgi:hypothetical protein
MELQFYDFQQSVRSENLEMKQAKTKTITFRISENELLELEKKANFLGVSVHQVAKSFVLENLANADGRKLLAEVAEIYNGLEKLKFCLADATEALLIMNKYPKEKARSWTNENIRQV